MTRMSKIPILTRNTTHPLQSPLQNPINMDNSRTSTPIKYPSTNSSSVLEKLLQIHPRTSSVSTGHNASGHVDINSTFPFDNCDTSVSLSTELDLTANKKDLLPPNKDLIDFLITVTPLVQNSTYIPSTYLNSLNSHPLNTMYIPIDSVSIELPLL